MNTKRSSSVDTILSEYCPYGEFVLSKEGSLIGGVTLNGADPDGFSKDDFLGLSMLIRSFYQQLPDNVVVSQYYFHYEGEEVYLKEREHPLSSLLSKNRAAYINEQGLSSSIIFHCFEVLPDENLSDLGFKGFFSNLLKSLYSKQARKVIKASLSDDKVLSVYEDEINKQHSQLKSTLNDLVARWDNVFLPSIMSIDDLWSFSKFLFNLSPHYISDSYNNSAPHSDWDISIPDSASSLADVDGMDVVKIHGNRDINYLRLLAINSFSENEIPWGIWASRRGSPCSLKGNILIMVRFKKLSHFGKAVMFNDKEREINRQNFDLIDHLIGQKKTFAEKEMIVRPVVREKLHELGQAELIQDDWATFQCYAGVWSNNTKELKNNSIELKLSADRAGLHTCWETVGLSLAYKSLMLTGMNCSVRNIKLNTTQLAAVTLNYRSSVGTRYVPELKDEAQYVLVSDDGSPFYYSPYTGGKSIVLGVGPTRSGKSFLKNILAAHFVKYGGQIVGIDVDPGLEPIADIFGDDGVVIKFDSYNDFMGFNPFVSARGADDYVFIAHLKNLMIGMLATNDTPQMKILTEEEQRSLDRAILSTLKMPKTYQSLTNVVKHCTLTLQNKFSRWVYDSSRPGMYHKFFDSPTDAVGSLDKKVMAFNVNLVKDDPILLPLVMAEIFFRTTRLFEDPDLRYIPQYLDVDESHQMLSVDYALKYLIRSSRTFSKYLCGIGLWTQSPKDFSGISNWEALRSAASTFIFLSDSNMNTESYKNTFLLSSGECQVIKELKPKREAFIVQRDTGIAKKVILEADSFEYVFATSNPHEAVLRKNNISQLGVHSGIKKTINDLNLKEYS